MNHMTQESDECGSLRSASGTLVDEMLDCLLTRYPTRLESQSADIRRPVSAFLSAHHCLRRGSRAQIAQWVAEFDLAHGDHRRCIPS